MRMFDVQYIKKNVNGLFRFYNMSIYVCIPLEKKKKMQNANFSLVELILLIDFTNDNAFQFTMSV